MIRTATLALGFLAANATAAFAVPLVVVNGDEWAFSNAGYAAAGPAQTDVLVKSLANALVGGASGDILIFSSNFGLTESSFLTSLAGWNVTVDSTGTLDAAKLAGFEAVFLAGNYSINAVDLAAFVNADNGVFVAAGTGVGGAAGEAAGLNPFLNLFGLGIAPVYNGLDFVTPISSTGFQVLYRNGNTVFDLDPLDPRNDVYEQLPSGGALFGVFVGREQVPAPAALTLFGLGVAALGFARRRG